MIFARVSKRLTLTLRHDFGASGHRSTFLPEHKVLLCTLCKVAVPSNDLDSHLRASHRGVRKSTRDSIRVTFTDVPAAKFTADLQPLPDGSPSSSFLVPARCSFYCPACTTFRSVVSVVEEEMRNPRRGIMQMMLELCIGTLCRIHISPRHKCGSVPIGIECFG
jgi:hypothetical protein